MADWTRLLMGDPDWNKVVDLSVGISDSIGGGKPDDSRYLLQVDGSEEGVAAGNAWSQGALTLDDIASDDSDAPEEEHDTSETGKEL